MLRYSERQEVGTGVSVTVEELLKLPSLRQAKVLGGHRGLSKIVSSISVLESTDPGALINGLFPQGEFYGSEIVITGFINIVDDIDCQCANIRRLAEGGEVGLILFYVGVYLPRVDQRLIDLANELDFVLISMPEGQRSLRYSEVISDVTEHIFRDRTRSASIVTDILARVSDLPEHQRTVNTVIKMLSDHLSASVILCDSGFHVLNLVSWPRGLEEAVKEGVESLETYPEKGEDAACAFLPDCRLYRLPVDPETQRSMELLILKEGTPLSRMVLEQAAEVIRLGSIIWGKRHEEIAIHELVRAILQDEPIKMRRLAEIFHVDVASIHEMWILCGDLEGSARWLQEQAAEIRNMLSSCADTVVADRYGDGLLLFLSEPESLRDAEKRIDLILAMAREYDPSITLTRYGDLQDTGEVRKAYLCHQTYLADTKKLFPQRGSFCQGETEFAQSCRELIDRGELAVQRCLEVLRNLQTNNEEWPLLDTLSAYLLDGEASVTRTAELLYLHKNTVKYRIQRISDLLGYRPDRMPETVKLYQAVAVERLLHMDN